MKNFLFIIALVLGTLGVSKGHGATVGVYFDTEGTQDSLQWAGIPGEVFVAYVIARIEDEIKYVGISVLLEHPLVLVNYDRPSGTGHFCCPNYTLDSGGGLIDFNPALNGYEGTPVILATLYLTTQSSDFDSAKITTMGYCGCIAAWPQSQLFTANSDRRTTYPASQEGIVIQEPVATSKRTWGTIQAIYR